MKRWSRASGFGLPASGLVLAAAFASSAAPPDQRLRVDGTRIEKLDFAPDAVESDDPSIARAELLPAGELLVEPLKPGVTRVFLFSRRSVQVLEVAVKQPLPEAAPAPTGACAQPVIDAACYAPWRARLQHLPRAEAPRLVFELDGLQAQARAARELLVAAGFTNADVSFSALGARLKNVPDKDQHRALRAIWPAVLGPLRIEP